LLLIVPNLNLTFATSGVKQQGNSIRAHPVDWASGGLNDEGLLSDDVPYWNPFLVGGVSQVHTALTKFARFRPCELTCGEIIHDMHFCVLHVVVVLVGYT
jgi:hypothetical protein